MMSHDHYTTLNGILAKKVNKAKGVNFIRFMTVAPEKKCSVICHYAIEEEYAQPFQDEHYNIGEGALYYGLHPSFDAEKIIAAIKQGHFCSEEKLNAFLYEQRALFSLHRTYKPYLESVFAMTVLRMASRFGFVFQTTEKALILFQQLKEGSELLVQGVTYKLDQEKRTVTFLGGFTDRLLQLLDRKGFSWIWDDEQKSLQLLLKHEAAVVHSFRDFDPSAHDVQLCYGSVYYSGVMPRVYRISVRESFSNQDVETMVLHAERTTYATLDAFDHGTVCAHPLLHSHYHLLTDFFRIEDHAQKVLFDGDPSQIKPLEMVELVNAYLRQSPNTHTVAVSGNIVDESGSLLLAMRHAQSIDSGTYYCSVNGQSEFADDHVSFYKESVFEDYPTLQADSNKRNDFSKELDRETDAELNIDRLARNWEYYGVSILGIRNSISIPEQVRRMHFNILASNKTNETFREIVTKAQSATEKFENQQIEQLSIWFYQDWKSRFIHYVEKGVSWVTEYNTILTSFFAFLYLVLVGDVASLVNGKSKDIFLNMVTYSLALIALFNTIFRVKQKNDIHKQIKPYQLRLVYAYGKEEPIRRLLTWIEKQSVLQKAHPIAVLMVSLYILKQAGHEEG